MERGECYEGWEWGDTGGRGQVGAKLAARRRQGIQQPKLQKRAAQSFYFIWNLKPIENVKM